MKAKAWSAIWLGIIFSSTISFPQPVHAQAARKPEKVAYKDGDGKWQFLAIKDIESRPEPKYPRTVKTAGVTFNFLYADVTQNTNVGFDDPVYGADRQATLEAVVSYFSSLLQETGQCDVEVALSQTDGTGPLASGGPYYFATPGFEPGLSFRHITTGTDPLPGTADMRLTVDFGYTYNNDTGPVGPSEVDLFSLLLHEMTHGLGFGTLISSTGASQLGSNVYSVYDSYLYRSGGTAGAGLRLINPNTFTFQALVSDLTSGQIEFRGGAAMAAFGDFVPVYSPSPWDGSSLAHWADGLTPEPVMARALGTGVEKRTYQPYELGALVDLGYHLRQAQLSVPPEIWTKLK